MSSEAGPDRAADGLSPVRPCPAPDHSPRSRRSAPPSARRLAAARTASADRPPHPRIGPAPPANTPALEPHGGACALAPDLVKDRPPAGRAAARAQGADRHSSSAPADASPRAKRREGEDKGEGGACSGDPPKVQP